MATKSDAVALPGARAVARHVRISPMKARRVVDLVRGLPAKEALTVLKFAPQAASETVYKQYAVPVHLLRRLSIVSIGIQWKRLKQEIFDLLMFKCLLRI